MPLGDQGDPTESLIWNIPLKVFLFTGTCTYKQRSTYKCTQLNFGEYFEKHASIYSQEVILRYPKDMLLLPNDIRKKMCNISAASHQPKNKQLLTYEI